MSFRFLVAVGVVMAVPTLLQAQYTPQQRNQMRQQAAMQPVSLQGRIQGMSKGDILVAANNQKYRVTVLPVTKVQVTGTTTAQFLRQGMIVEFTAEIDANNAIKGPVEALTITSLTRDRQMGFFPADGAEVADGFGIGGKKEKKADADADNEKPQDQAPPEPPAKPGKRPPRPTGKGAAHAQPAGNYRIVGRLGVARNGDFTIMAGRATMPFQLSEKAKISIDMSDFSLVGVGTEVSVTAYMVPNRPGVLRAAEIQVKLQAPGQQPEPAARPKKT